MLHIDIDKSGKDLVGDRGKNLNKKKPIHFVGIRVQYCERLFYTPTGLGLGLWCVTQLSPIC